MVFVSLFCSQMESLSKYFHWVTIINFNTSTQSEAPGGREVSRALDKREYLVLIRDNFC